MVPAKIIFNKMNIVRKEITLPDGRVITLETGKLAKQADGAVMATLGNTMLLATVCSAKDAVPGTDFMPLTVEYKEKFASAGVSAVPMAARVSQAEGQKADPSNFLLMHAMGPNVAGVIGSAVAAGILLTMLG